MPEGSLTAYRTAEEWREFKNIVDDVATGISSINAAADGEKEIYGLDGKRVNSLKPGHIYIIDGKKTMVR